MIDPSSLNLLILAKRPALGKAKTRLAATVGAENALEIYHILLNKTIELASLPGVQAFFCLSGDEDCALPPNSIEFEQSNGDLGHRMEKAFQHVFDLVNEPVIMIGSDCFDLNEEHLKRAEEALKENDLVFGPSEDGGYYLIGMKKFIPEVLQDMPWSTEQLLDVTRSKAEELGFGYSMLEVLNDIDTFADMRGSSIWQELPEHLKNF